MSFIRRSLSKGFDKVRSSGKEPATPRSADPFDDGTTINTSRSSRSSSMYTPREEACKEPVTPRTASSSRLLSRVSRSVDRTRSSSKTPKGEDPYMDAVTANAELQLDIPKVPITCTSLGQRIPRFACDALDVDGKVLFRFDSERPTGAFMVLALFSAEEEWVLCRNAISRLEDVYRRLSHQEGCKFLAISRNQRTPELNAFRRGLGAIYTLPMAPDVDGKIFSLFATDGVPRFYLLDDQYTILRQAFGPMTPSFMDHIQQLAYGRTGIFSARTRGVLDGEETAENGVHPGSMQAAGRAFPMPAF